MASCPKTSERVFRRHWADVVVAAYNGSSLCLRLEGHLSVRTDPPSVLSLPADALLIHLSVTTHFIGLQFCWECITIVTNVQGIS